MHDNRCWLDYRGDQPEIYSNFRLCYICQLYLNEMEKGKNAPVRVLPFPPWATSTPPVVTYCPLIIELTYLGFQI